MMIILYIINILDHIWSSLLWCGNNTASDDGLDDSLLNIYNSCDASLNIHSEDSYVTILF